MIIFTPNTIIKSADINLNLGNLLDELEYPCAFSVYNQTAGEQTSTTNPAVFDAERFDVGNNFSTSTYKFTAPVKGIYQFNWNALSTASQSGRSGFWGVVNGAAAANLGSFNHGGGDTGATVNFSWTYVLYANDSMWIQPQAGYTMRFYGGNLHNAFSGHLVRKLA